MADEASEPEGSDMTRQRINSATVLAAAGLAIFASAVAHSEAATDNATSQGRPIQALRVMLTIEGGETVEAALVDNGATRDFLALLPLSLTLNDHAGTEKVSDLPRRLSKAGAPPGHDPSPGDIAYYAPWGNLAIYYRDFGYSDGLVLLGKLDHVPISFSGPGPIRVTITAE